LARDGQVILESGYGLADRSDPGSAIDPETPLNIGSIGKLFTQVLVLEKVAKGEWALNDTVADHWPDSGIPNAEAITIAQLLSHQSGLGNYFVHPDYGLAQRESADFLELVRTQELAFDPPGTGIQYSNSAFWVLDELLRRSEADTRSWLTRFEQEIFAPIGMEGVRAFQPDEESTNRPRGYFISVVGELRDVTDQDPRPGPDGGLYATPRDLFLFAEAVRAGRWYDSELFLASQETVGEMGIHDCRFALTWEICPVGGTRLVTKGGTTMGGGAELILFEHGGHDYTLVLLANVSNAPLELMPELIAYTLDQPGARLPGPRLSVAVHEAIEAGELSQLEADFPGWLSEQGLNGDPIPVYLLARHYQSIDQADRARRLLRLNVAHFDGHPLSARRLEAMEGGS
jgi:CubicO group peptidase (beta-lactamase class C family)